jgi:hypothetical protein
VAAQFFGGLSLLAHLALLQGVSGNAAGLPA